MYYNIKIKSDGSEFSLESENKSIIEREMDVYFAQIFNASEDFKSKIKKVEVNNLQVKSINELEFQKDTSKELEIKKDSLKSDISLKHDATIKAIQEEVFKTTAENIQTKIKELNLKPEIEEIPNKENTFNVQEDFHTETPVESPIEIEKENDFIEEQATPIINQIENQPQGEIKTIEPVLTIATENETLNSTPQICEEIVQEITQTHVTFKVEKIETLENNIEPINKINEIKFQNAIDKKDDVDELISLAQTQLDKIDLNINHQTNKQTQVTFQNTPQEDKDIDFDKGIVNFDLKKSSDVYEKPVIDVDMEKYKQQFEIKNMQNLNEIFSNNIEESKAIEPQIQIQTVDMQEKMENIIPEKQPIEQETTNIAKENIQEKQIDKQTFAQNIDFKPFLTTLKCENINDEFIACAFYIKNILKQENFTMKFINSKLFQATGNIASLSVVDELIEKKHIKTYLVDESNKYCITQDGEEYFAQKFQG